MIRLVLLYLRVFPFLVFAAESTLENFANIGEHHQSDYGYLGCMFTPASRPESLRILYRYTYNVFKAQFYHQCLSVLSNEYSI